MKFQTTFIMERIKYFLKVYQREYTEFDRECHFYFALAVTLSELNLTELELDELIKTFIEHTPYPKKK